MYFGIKKGLFNQLLPINEYIVSKMKAKACLISIKRLANNWKFLSLWVSWLNSNTQYFVICDKICVCIDTHNFSIQHKIKKTFMVWFGFRLETFLHFLWPLMLHKLISKAHSMHMLLKVLKWQLGGCLQTHMIL